MSQKMLQNQSFEKLPQPYASSENMITVFTLGGTLVSPTH